MITNIIGDIPIYFINLNRSVDRYNLIVKLFEENNIVKWKKIEAIDGNNLDVNLYNHVENITKYELACTLSHFKAIETAFEDGLDEVLIAEDDCNFDYIQYKKISIKTLVSMKTDLELLQLAICCRIERNKTIVNNTDLLIKGYRDCATCYYINKKGMEKIIKYKNDFEILNNSENTIYKITISYLTKPYFSYYYSDSLKSSIHQNTSYQREDHSKKFWDNYYLNNQLVHKNNQNYTVIFLIIDSDNLPIYKFNREVWKSYMNSNPSIKCYFVKYSNIQENYRVCENTNTIYLKGEEIFDGKHIFNKTILACKIINELFDYDYLIRTNISTFWNFTKLIEILKPRQKNKYFFGWLLNDPYNNKFISGTGIIIPKNITNKLITLSNQSNWIESISNIPSDQFNDDVQISKLLLDNDTEIKDVGRFGKYLIKFEESDFDSIDKIFDKPDLLEYVCYRVKSISNREIYDSYVLTKLLSMIYNINISNPYDTQIMIKQKVNYIKKQPKIYIFVSKKTKSYSSFYIDWVVENFPNTNVEFVDDYKDPKTNIVLTHICERSEYYGSDPKCLNIIVATENRSSKYKYDIAFSTIDTFNAHCIIDFYYVYQAIFEYKKSINPKDHIRKKTKFCAYMYSVDHKHRINIFNLITQYKKVDALGKSCKNVDIIDSRNVLNESETYNDIAVEIYSGYKFVISMENTFAPGYFSEKLLNPIIANSIPIYWGPPDVFNYFNKKRFIYIPDYTQEELIEKIKYLDENESEYNKIIEENIFTDKCYEPNNFISNVKDKFNKLLSL